MQAVANIETTDMTNSQTSMTSGLPSEAENCDWIVMKSLIDSHELLMAAMEQHALASMSSGETVDEEDLIAQLDQIRNHHERLIEDIETAIAALDEQSTTAETESYATGVED